MSTGAIVITGEQNIKNARILTLRAALRLECKGMKRSGRSVCSIVKQEFGFIGSKQKVLNQLDKWITDHSIPNLSITH
jgi:hypothetical protein